MLCCWAHQPGGLDAVVQRTSGNNGATDLASKLLDVGDYLTSERGLHTWRVGTSWARGDVSVGAALAFRTLGMKVVWLWYTAGSVRELHAHTQLLLQAWARGDGRGTG